MLEQKHSFPIFPYMIATVIANKHAIMRCRRIDAEQYYQNIQLQSYVLGYPSFTNFFGSKTDKGQNLAWFLYYV